MSFNGKLSDPCRPVSRQYHASIAPVPRQYRASIRPISCLYHASITPVSCQQHASSTPVARQQKFIEIHDASIAPVSRQYRASKTHEEAFALVQTKWRTFRTYRKVAEARLVDLLAFERLVVAHLNPTLSNCDAEAKKTLQRTTSKAKLKDLHLA